VGVFLAWAITSDNTEVKTTYQALARTGSTTPQAARRSQVILLAAQGTPNRAGARQVGVSRPNGKVMFKA